MELLQITHGYMLVKHVYSPVIETKLIDQWSYKRKLLHWHLSNDLQEICKHVTIVTTLIGN